jgi:hypothetical protein
MPSRSFLAGLLLVLPGVLPAQQDAVRARLEARGLPADIAGRIAEVAAEARSQGLPADALVGKAVEGWAKHVAGPRLVAAVQQYAVRLGSARDAVVGAGLAEPPGDVVVAAGDALGQGLGVGEVEILIRAGARSRALGAGLSVAGALAAQGLGPSRATGIVAEALRTGRPIADVLDLPSVARALRAQGLGTAEIGRRMMSGGGALGPASGGVGGAGGARPGGVPQGMPGGQQNQPSVPPGGGHRPPDAP